MIINKKKFISDNHQILYLCNLVHVFMFTWLEIHVQIFVFDISTVFMFSRLVFVIFLLKAFY